jgi:hypothetical protein
MVLAGRLLASKGPLAVLVKNPLEGSAVRNMELAFAALPEVEGLADPTATVPLAKGGPSDERLLFSGSNSL